MKIGTSRLVQMMLAIGTAACLITIAIGSIENSSFWLTSDQSGQRLENAGDHKDAAKVYTDPMRQGTALYRAGDFKAAAIAFASVGSPEGAFNRGNALLLQGAYDDCIKSYDLALPLRPGWQPAIDNKNLAIARKDLLDIKNKEDSGDTDKPDSISIDTKPSSDHTKVIQINAGEVASDDAMQAAWLRRVQTKPADFLRAKFSFQLQQPGGTP